MHVAIRDWADASPPTADYVLFWGLACPPPDLTPIANLPGDVWHAGLTLGTGGLPAALDRVAPTWPLHAAPDPTRPATSWRVSARACLVRAEALAVARPSGFETRTGEALAQGMAWLRAGLITRHVPDLLPPGIAFPPEEPPSRRDELRFVELFFGRRWRIYAGWRPAQHSPPAPPRTAPLPAAPLPAAPAESVVIPTLDRYPYLRRALDDLAAQTRPPDEVIVVDQSTHREPLEHAGLPLRVLPQAEPGQCTARNAGIAAAHGAVILFVDDDDTLPPGLIAAHLALIHKADATCGAVTEVGAPPPPRREGIAAYFPANNGMVRADVLRAVGGFDPAFDHGIRADADLGMRLYRAGALLLHAPEAHLIHHRAPSGGLRHYGQRRIT
ncbi:MAG: glycosyltransferase family 2 protein, partial [Anaerolineae bacterium]